MAKSFSILPCNGLDKCAGCIAKEIALKITDKSESEIICPVFFRVADAQYKKLAEDKPLVVIDGCQTRCASRLAAEKGLKVSRRVNVTDEAKNRAVEISKILRPGTPELEMADIIATELLKESEAEKAAESLVHFPEIFEYEIYKKDKFIFSVPREGFYFNENDCWVYVSGNRARVGVTDYVQQSLSDIMFFTPPIIGTEVEQFGEVGTIESGKAVFEVISPVSGKVTAVNEELTSTPELINQNPYEKGWIAELELSDFDSDKELLLDFEGYFKIMKKKVDEFNVKKN
jgi:glycine cleavage system H protein